MPKKNEPALTPKPYVESGNIEAHIIADMLRIESISSELREFKEITKEIEIINNINRILLLRFII